jgi:hypothetical protein
MMLVQADESDEIPINIAGTLDAAHKAIRSFILLHSLLPARRSVVSLPAPGLFGGGEEKIPNALTACGIVADQ